MQNAIKRGSAAWRELFFDNDVEAFMGPGNSFDSLSYKGDLSAILDDGRPKILITGSRILTDYGQEMTARIVRTLSENPWKPVIVTGLAIGADTSAVKAALNMGLSCVAVLPNGIDTVYPYCNRPLAEELASTPGCALLTQFPEQTTPLAQNFILRTKTMAMLSDIAVIAESRIEGSAMIAAKLMDQRNRRVFAVPGRLGDPYSAGCNRLIESKLAEIYTDGYTEKLLRELNVLRKSSEYFYDVTE